MNIYFAGMCVSLAVYIVIGIVVSRKIRGVDDYYVAGRRAPMILIAGSLIASYTSTGMFMGDAAQSYSGCFTSIITFAGMQSAGYVLGAVFFGRYLRRSNVLTIPEFFGKRFHSRAVRNLSAITAIIMMTVYLLSVMQGIGTLMKSVTGVDYRLCIVIALVVFAFITIKAGSSGVLITDTLMAGIFTGALIVATIVISHRTGGWFHTVSSLASSPRFHLFMSWGGQPGSLYQKAIENLLWGLIYGVVWMSVCMVGPWQSSRYLMAKDEHTAVRASIPAAIGVFALEFLVSSAAVFVNMKNPGMKDSSQVMIWAAMHLMPKLLGVILLTGVLAAGISSATTFLSLIGASVANDIVGTKWKNPIRVGQIAMGIVSAVVLLVAIFNPPSIFWIMFLGGAIVSASWMPVALGSVFSKRLTKAGAFAGILCGFLACFFLRLYTALAGVTLPVYLDPSVVGILANIAAMCIATKVTSVTEEEKAARARMFVMPDSEKDPEQMRKTLRISKRALLIGPGTIAVLLIFWVIPYLVGAHAG